MRAITRRKFVGGAVAVAALSSTKFSFGMPMGLTPGIQLYSVRQQMAQDFEGALAAVREAGFVEVESASLPKKPATEIRAALDKAGLKCVSSHRSFDDITKNLDATTEFEKTLGVSYIICPSPGRRNPAPTNVWPGSFTLAVLHAYIWRDYTLGRRAATRPIPPPARELAPRSRTK